MADEIPLVCYDADLCRLLNLTHRTLRRLRTRRCLPIPELPRLIGCTAMGAVTLKPI